MAPFRPLDFESDVTAGTIATRSAAMMAMTTSNSSNVKAPERLRCETLKR